jgi:hypothetical protein
MRAFARNMRSSSGVGAREASYCAPKRCMASMVRCSRRDPARTPLLAPGRLHVSRKGLFTGRAPCEERNIAAVSCARCVGSSTRFRFIRTCCVMRAGTSLPMTGRTRGRCNTISGTGTSSTRRDIRSCRQSASRVFGRTDVCPVPTLIDSAGLCSCWSLRKWLARAHCPIFFCQLSGDAFENACFVPQSADRSQLWHRQV